MTKELIQKLIGRARSAADNAYCPVTEVAVGACLLTNTNQMVMGCNLEFEAAPQIFAGEAALMKSVSEGMLNFSALALWAENIMPYPNALELERLAEFNPVLDIIVAQGDTFVVHKLHELLPRRRVYGN